LGYFDYVRPNSLEEALSYLADGEGKVIAGGTDLVLLLKEGKLQPQRLVGLQRIPAVCVMEEEAKKITLGAGITFAKLATSPLVQLYARPLAQAALQMGSVQIRNVATLGGNIATGSPAADGVVPLLALDARVLIRSPRENVKVELSRLLDRKAGQAVLRGDEMIVGVEFPKPFPGTRGIFIKLGRRNAKNIARLSLCACLKVGSGGVIERAAIALGAAGPFPFRLIEAERLLVGNQCMPKLIEEVVEEISRALAKNLGNRASAPYKSYAIRGLAREALEQCFKVCDGGE